MTKRNNNKKEIIQKENDKQSSLKSVYFSQGLINPIKNIYYIQNNYIYSQYILINNNMKSLYISQS